MKRNITESNFQTSTYRARKAISAEGVDYGLALKHNKSHCRTKKKALALKDNPSGKIETRSSVVWVKIIPTEQTDNYCFSMVPCFLFDLAKRREIKVNSGNDNLILAFVLFLNYVCFSSFTSTEMPKFCSWACVLILSKSTWGWH